jgi:hypothetical protein
MEAMHACMMIACSIYGRIMAPCTVSYYTASLVLVFLTTAPHTPASSNNCEAVSIPVRFVWACMGGGRGRGEQEYCPCTSVCQGDAFL